MTPLFWLASPAPVVASSDNPHVALLRLKRVGVPL
jgi:hypothetical protein